MIFFPSLHGFFCVIGHFISSSESFCVIYEDPLEKVAPLSWNMSYLESNSHDATTWATSCRTSLTVIGCSFLTNWQHVIPGQRHSIATAQGENLTLTLKSRHMLRMYPSLLRNSSTSCVPFCPELCLFWENVEILWAHIWTTAASIVIHLFLFAQF